MIEAFIASYFACVIIVNIPAEIINWLTNWSQSPSRNQQSFALWNVGPYDAVIQYSVFKSPAENTTVRNFNPFPILAPYPFVIYFLTS